MTKLTDVQVKLAEQLLLSVKNKEMNIEYNELASRINPPIHWRQVGRNIGEVSKLCHELGLPLISAKVVNKNSQRAGDGFYPLYEMLGIPTEGKTEKELFRQERAAIRSCKEWYKLEDYLGLHIGFERPSGSAPNAGRVEPVSAEIDSVPVVSPVVTPPPEYLNPSVHVFSAANPTPFRLSADVLNYGLGMRYVGSFKKGWQQATFDFVSNGTAYTIWFPKISTDGTPASAYGWINIITDDGNTFIEKAADTHPNLGYDSTDTIRIVFTKTKNGPYLFAGVFLPDLEHSSYGYHILTRVSDEADFSGDVPIIRYFRREDEADDALISELKNDSLTGAPKHFQHYGKAKEKVAPIVVSGRTTYPRDRQTSINALSHANYRCEIEPAHTTFLRKHSGKPYTEPHHLIPMAFSDEFSVSLDVEENIVSLCSNCHNHIHYGQGAEKLLTKLYYERRDALKSVGLEISLDQLLGYYQLQARD